MSDYIQDPALLEKLSTSVEVKKDEYVSDPAVLEKIQASPSGGQKDDMPEGKDIGVKEVVQTALPAITPSGPTGVGALASEVGGAVSPYAKGAVSAATQGYRAHPLLTPLIDAVGIGTMGTPVATAYNSVMGAADQYQRAQGAVKDVGKVLSQSSLIESPITGVAYPESVPAFRDMQKAAPEIAQKLSDVYQKGGGNNGVKAWLQTEEAAKFMKDPKFAAAAEQYVGKVPGAGAQAMKVAGPIMRGAGKMLGPAGLALNAYDAQQYAEAAKLGERLAEGQGGIAQQAFRNVQLNRPTPAPLTPQEATNLLASGDQRTIDIYGGAAALQQIATGQSVDVMTQPPNAMNFLGRVKEMSKRYKNVGN